MISAIEKLSERTEEARAEEVQRKWGLSLSRLKEPGRREDRVKG